MFEITICIDTVILSALMKNRLNAIIEGKGLSATKFATLIDANPSAISHLLKGRNKPGYDLLVSIAKAFPDISMDWLLTGEGEMYNSSKNKGETESVKSTTLNPETKESNESQQEYRAMAQKLPSPEIAAMVPPIPQQKELKRIILFFTDGSFEDYNK
ncbi:MAG: helix-turn-helix domain-containing protein [Oscillibacter sp.]|nr:helix-turn-helix domain-containing protein [Oscillibacter sp.]